MINPVPQKANYYPVYGPAMVENHTNPEAEAFRQKLKDEINVKQAYVRVEFIQNTLEHYKNSLTQPQMNVLLAELADAQRDFSMLTQQLNAKYGVN